MSNTRRSSVTFINMNASPLIHRLAARWPKAKRETAPPTMQTTTPCLQATTSSRPTFSIKTVVYPTTGMLETVPKNKIAYNGTFDEKKQCPVVVSNASDRPIAWAIKVTNTKRLEAVSGQGVLAPNENVIVVITCDAFQAAKDIRPDRIILEWASVPDGSSKTFQPKWQIFGNDRRKNIEVEYNL
uniref:Major sperm protein n=1 Tax=Panagrellus redivivus TaxID=6233 RepID=A0A7E4UYW5_PANRE